jgi:hypothetical protein
VTNETDHHVESPAAMATRYRQRRLVLLVALLAVTVLPIIAVGAWWMWPLLVIPAVLAAPLAGGAGLLGTLLATAIALAAASAGNVSTGEITAGFVAVIVVAALGAVHVGMSPHVCSWTLVPWPGLTQGLQAEAPGSDEVPLGLSAMIEPTQ